MIIAQALAVAVTVALANSTWINHPLPNALPVSSGGDCLAHLGLLGC